MAYKGTQLSASIGALMRTVQEGQGKSPINVKPGDEPGAELRKRVDEPIPGLEAPDSSANITNPAEGIRAPQGDGQRTTTPQRASVGPMSLGPIGGLGANLPALATKIGIGKSAPASKPTPMFARQGFMMADEAKPNPFINPFTGLVDTLNFGNYAPPEYEEARPNPLEVRNESPRGSVLGTRITPSGTPSTSNDGRMSEEARRRFEEMDRETAAINEQVNKALRNADKYIRETERKLPEIKRQSEKTVNQLRQDPVVRELERRERVSKELEKLTPNDRVKYLSRPDIQKEANESRKAVDEYNKKRGR